MVLMFLSCSRLTPEGFIPAIIAFIEDSLLVANISVTHHGETVTIEEKLSPALQTLMDLTWLRLTHTFSVVY